MTTLENQNRYAIVDTGYIKADRSGNIFTGSNIVNSGTFIPLNVESISWSEGVSADNAPSPGTLTNTTGGVPINIVSCTHAMITVGILIDKTNTNDTIRIRHLSQLKKTRGLKVFWYNDAGQNNKIQSIIDELGYDFRNDNHSGNHGLDASEPHVHVHVKSFTLNSNDSSLNFWRGTLTLEVDDI